VVDGENAPVSYNTIGFWSIGKGASAALNRIALYLSKYQQFSSLEEAVYVAVTAKFAAESTGNAGPSTFAVIHGHITETDDQILIPDGAIEIMRKVWNETGVPPVPDSVLEGLRMSLPVLRKRTTKQAEKFMAKRSSSRKPKG
jgi:hypothetical protein